MPLSLGIIGYPLKHSISRVFQQAALDYYAMDIRYEVWETPPAQLPTLVTRWRDDGVLGANVTVPYKEVVCAYLDQLTELSKYLGNVNTVLFRKGLLVGDNTDAYGFMRALEEHGEFHPNGKNILVLGAGGVARTVALTLSRAGIASITIANRAPQRAQQLASVLKCHLEHVESVPLEPEALAKVGKHVRWDLIVNCTTIGMRHGPVEHETPISADLIPQNALVYDLVYNPKETPFLREASKVGAQTLGGLPMLVYQGAAAFCLWTEKEPPVELMFRAAEMALAKQ